MLKLLPRWLDQETLICLFVGLILFVPFANKAFHMDSPVTVYMARQIAKDPLNPPIGHYGTLLAPWNHTRLPASSAYYATPHPPLLPFYILPWLSCFGENELALTLGMLPFYLLIIVLTHRLMRIILPSAALFGALLIAMSPAVLVNAHNIMNDVPVTALMMASLYCMVRTGRKSDALLSGLFAGLACLTKVTAGTLIVSAALYYLTGGKTKNLLVFCVPFAICNVLWMLHNLYFFGEMQLFGNGHAHYLWGDVRFRFERMLSFTGGAMVFPLLILGVYAALAQTRNWTLAVLVASSIWAGLLINHLHYSLLHAGAYAVFASAGIMIIGRTICKSFASEKRPWLPLGTHLVLQLVGGLFLTLFAVRYLLPVVFVLILSWTTDVFAIKKVSSRILVCALALAISLIVSILLCVSDLKLVNAEKQVAQDLLNQYHDRLVVYHGRLGYLYYMDKAGFTSALDLKSGLKPGDIFVRNSLYRDDYMLWSGMKENLHILDTLRYPVFPLRTIGNRAGFYGNDRLPYSWGSSERIFEVFEFQGPQDLCDGRSNQANQ